MHPAVSRVFYSADFSESRYFRVQVFQGPHFSESRLSWVQVFQGPGLGPDFRRNLEIDQINFLDTHLHNKDGIYVTKENTKEKKIPTHWSSQITRRYKSISIKNISIRYHFALERFPLTSKRRLNSLETNS